jgi:dTDP-4-amino-4,6-dideoxygalactose transaminase
VIAKDYIPFGKPNFSDEEIAAVTRVLKSGWIGMGPETIAFETELAEFVGAPYVVAVNSCTSALFLSLLVRGIGPGDEVICPSLTWCSSATVALHLGARTVFCDVAPDTMCVTTEDVLAQLSPRTKAVVVVHFGGLAVDVKALRDALPENVDIVEDAAHALGACYPDGDRVGSSGNLTCFSFYGNKNLSTAEGGAIATTDARIANRLRSLRQHGMPVDAWKRFSDPRCVPPTCHLELGYKMNYTDLQASLGRVQLRRQPEFHGRRREIAEHYHMRLSKSECKVRFQSDILHPYHCRHLFVIRLPIDEFSFDRDQLLQELRNRNIGASIHYPPLHWMPLFWNGSSRPELPRTEQLYREILTLPISASITLEEAQYVTDHFHDLVKQGSTGFDAADQTLSDASPRESFLQEAPDRRLAAVSYH